MESTEVLRLGREFHDFVESATKRRRSSFQNQLNEASQNESELSSLSYSRGSISMRESKERQKEAELCKQRLQILQLESKLSDLEHSTKRARIDQDRDLSQKLIQSEHKLDKVDELQQQLRRLADREEDARQEVTMLRSQLNQVKSQYEHKMAALRKENLQMQQQVTQTEEDLRSEMAEKRSELDRLRSELGISKAELSHTQDLLTACNVKHKEMKSQLAELEETKQQLFNTECKLKTLQRERDKEADDAVVVKAMKSQLARLTQLETENRKLKSKNEYLQNTQENIFMLREEVESLKSKLARAEEKGAQYDSLLVQYEELEGKFRRWEVEDQAGHKAIKSPWELTREVSHLQTANATLLQKEGHLQSSLHVLEEKVRELESGWKSAREQLAKEQTQHQLSSQLVKRLQKKLLLLTKERDGFKNILDSYESEVTMHVDGVTERKIRGLEDALTGYQRQIQQLEGDLQTTSDQLLEARTHAAQLEGSVLQSQSPLNAIISEGAQVDQKIILELRNQIAELERKLEELQDDNQMLQIRINHSNMQGDYDPRKTKVIHMPVNPLTLALSRRQDELQALRDACSQLEEKVRTLEAKIEILESSGSGEDLTVRIQQAAAGSKANSSQIQELKAEVKSAELKNKRLMEVFQRKSQELRQVSYQLLGFRIDIPTDNQYRLMSMYAESRDDFLLFQQSAEGELQMLNTPFSETMMEKHGEYLTQSHSIPVFLSSITMDMYARQTMLQESTIS